MNKFLIPAIAVSAVTLLSGCQVVSVRHHYPEPVRVVGTHRTVVVDHRDVVVYEQRHDSRPPQRVVVQPVKTIKVVPPRPPVRVVVPVHRHEKPERGRPEQARPPAHRDKERRQRQPGKVHPQVKVIPVTPQVKAARGFAAQVARQAAVPVKAKPQKVKEPARAKQEHNKPKQEEKQDKKEHRDERQEREERRRGG